MAEYDSLVTSKWLRDRKKTGSIKVLDGKRGVLSVSTAGWVRSVLGTNFLHVLTMLCTANII